MLSEILLTENMPADSHVPNADRMEPPCELLRNDSTQRRQTLNREHT